MKEMSLLEEEEDSMIGGDQQLCFLSFFFFIEKCSWLFPLGGWHIEFATKCSNICNILINDVYILNRTSLSLNKWLSELHFWFAS